MDQNFEIRILWFLRIFFLKFSKRRRAVPLRPIWTIMVAAKLDQSRVLVTKFRENRLTLKGRSAGQRQTDTRTHTQTNSAENKGPSGLQSGQQTTLLRPLVLYLVYRPVCKMVLTEFLSGIKFVGP